MLTSRLQKPDHNETKVTSFANVHLLSLKLNLRISWGLGDSSTFYQQREECRNVKNVENACCQMYSFLNFDQIRMHFACLLSTFIILTLSEYVFSH